MQNKRLGRLQIKTRHEFGQENVSCDCSATVEDCLLKPHKSGTGVKAVHRKLCIYGLIDIYSLIDSLLPSLY